MKKLALLLVATLLVLITSCGSDDEAPDPIIGVWTLSERFQNDVEVELTNCMLDNAIIAMPDGTFTSKFYREESNNACELYLETPGSWQNLGDNRHTLIEEGKEPFTSEINKDLDTLSVKNNFEFQGNLIVQKEVFVKL